MSMPGQAAASAAKFRTDVLIVGAGSTGLALALYLAQQGVSCQVVERSPTGCFEEVEAAVCLHSRTLELFARLGLVEGLLARSARRNSIDIHIDGKLRIRGGHAAIDRADTPYPYHLILPAGAIGNELERALAAHGIEVRRSAQLVQIESGFTFVEAQIADNRGTYAVRARYLVGCDGAESLVRDLGGFGWGGKTKAGEIIQGDVYVEGFEPGHRDVLSIFVARGMVASFSPLATDGLSRVSVLRHRVTDDETDRTSLSAVELERHFNAATGAQVRLCDPARLTRRRLRHRSTLILRQDRVFLAGQAACIHAPFGGDGMNAGIEDAANLAWKISQVLHRRAPATLLDTYQTERWPVSQRMIGLMDLACSLFLTDDRISRAVRRVLLPIASLAWRLRKAMCERILSSRLSTRYPIDGMVAQDDLSGHAVDELRTAVLPGSRAPNAALCGGLELFDLMNEYRFHALVLSRGAVDTATHEAISRFCEARWSGITLYVIVAATNQPGPSQIQATRQDVFARYGVADKALFVVRPDGYVGYRSDLSKF